MSISNKKLHIEELNKRFKTYSKITVDDFNKFYNDVFGKINKNTVSWNIYKLKEMGIIRNIARGQYVLTNKKEDNIKDYIVLTMDIAESTKIDYKEFNSRLRKKLSLLNKAINNVFEIDRCYNISQGDEIQILFPFSVGVGKMIMLTLCYLYPFEVRYGISIGKVKTEILKNTWKMNGPIFWNARDQLEKVKNQVSYEGLIISGYSKTDNLCNNVLPLINRSLDKITKKQWQAIKYYLRNIEVDKAIKDIGISRSSYYERLKTSNIEEIISSFRTIYDLMKLRREIK